LQSNEATSIYPKELFLIGLVTLIAPGRGHTLKPWKGIGGLGRESTYLEKRRRVLVTKMHKNSSGLKSTSSAKNNERKLI
jgi:hypothetical protein